MILDVTIRDEVVEEVTYELSKCNSDQGSEVDETYIFVVISIPSGNYRCFKKN